MRKPLAMFLVCVFLVAYIGVAATIGSNIVDSPRWVQLVFYVVAGIAWALPLKPLMDWMNSDPNES